MANYVTGVNPKILKWARERAGYTIEDIAEAFKKDIEIIHQWEMGERSPTYNQLERLADSFYKRPVALFFFPVPPDEPEPEKSFRTLPDFEIEALSPDTRYAIREVQARQIALMELNNGINPSKQKIFQDIKLNPTSDAQYAALAVRDYLGITIQEQAKWKDPNEALKFWREMVQDSGIFVFKRSFKQEDVSGICLVHQEFPVIYLNNSTTTTRQIFTLFHELAHILLDTNGVTKIDERYIKFLSGVAKDIEVLCNRFAAEVLIPTDDFSQQIGFQQDPKQLIQYLSNRYSVSREVVARRLLDLKIIDKKFYKLQVDLYNIEYQESKAKRRDRSGGSYYVTQAAYLGEKYLNLAFRKYYQGDVTTQQLADYLNMKARNILELEQFVMKKAVAT